MLFWLLTYLPALLLWPLWSQVCSRLLCKISLMRTVIWSKYIVQHLICKENDTCACDATMKGIIRETTLKWFEKRSVLSVLHVYSLWAYHYWSHICVFRVGMCKGGEWWSARDNCPAQGEIWLYLLHGEQHGGQDSDESCSRAPDPSHFRAGREEVDGSTELCSALTVGKVVCSMGCDMTPTQKPDIRAKLKVFVTV